MLNDLTWTLNQLHMERLLPHLMSHLLSCPVIQSILASEHSLDNGYQSIIHKIQKHFQNVMLVGMASEISKNCTYKCVDCLRHNGIKGAKAKCAQ